MPILGGASHFTISGYARLYHIQGNAVINQITDAKELKRFQSVINVPRAQASQKDYQAVKKSGPCFEGTRVALIQEIEDWPYDPGKSKIYILSGLAGIGKSTVAYTVATRADDRGLLGASFFFSRDDADRSNAKKFFTTLAYQLCLYNEGFAQAIADALITERGSTATVGSPQEQLEALILEPLQGVAMSSGQPIIVVVDALDECDDKDANSVIMGLRRIVQDLPSFRIILTTRPQPLLSNYSTTASDHKIFHLQDIEDKVVNGDIRLYLKHSLSLQQVKEHLPGLRREWCAGDTEIESLVHAAGKLFIIASTAVLFILDKIARDPKGQMARVLGTFSQDRDPSKRLNDFYSVILQNAVPEGCDDYIVKRHQSVIGSIAVLQVSLSIMTLSRLICRREEEIEGALDNLPSVIMIGEDDVPHIYHKSFLDYVTDPVRCKDVDLRIDSRDRHTRIVTQCFELMNGDLKYNILGLDGPARFMDNQEGLAHQRISNEKLQEKITPWLRYACVYWGKHLEGANNEDARLIEQLRKFADNHMLHWFEVLSLIGILDLAHRSIRIALRLVKPTSSYLFQLLSDGLRFISRFYELIRKSVLHTYYSALPFTPTKSLLYRQYQSEAVNGICRVTGGPEQWDALVSTQEHGSGYDFHVQCSHDSAMFATLTYSRSLDMKFWDAATGTPISTLSFTSWRVSIANDFSIVASAKDNHITLYSIKGSTPLAATFTASAEIWKLALSSESRRVATWLSDGTIRLWDIGNGELIASFGRSDYEFAFLGFSPTGTRLIFASNEDIQLRDGITGELIANLHDSLHRHPKLVFSNDGSRFAALTRGGVILRESESGELTGVAATNPECNILAISHDGSLLAIYDHTKLQVWSENSLNTLALIEEYPWVVHVHSMTFSLEDMLAIATPGKVTLCDVRNHSVIYVLSIYSPSSLSFSPDCTRLAAICGQGNEILYLWDVQSIKALVPRSTEEAVCILRLAFSQDDGRLACQLNNGAIVLFEMATERMILIHDRQDNVEVAVSLRFSTNGRKLAAHLANNTVILWDSEDGTLIGTLVCPYPMKAVALSDHLLAGARMWYDEIMLWDLGTFDLIGTIKRPSLLFYSDCSKHLLFSNNGDLLALREWEYGYPRSSTAVTVSDVMKRTSIATFHIQGFINYMAFLPNDSQLVAQLSNGSSRLLNIVNNEVTHGPTFNHLAQFSYIPVWHGIPVGIFPGGNQPRSILGSFSRHENPEPVLRIPEDFQFTAWAQGSSTIALACKNGKVIFIRSSNDHPSPMFNLDSLAHESLVLQSQNVQSIHICAIQ